MPTTGRQPDKSDGDTWKRPDANKETSNTHKKDQDEKSENQLIQELQDMLVSSPAKDGFEPSHLAVRQWELLGPLDLRKLLEENVLRVSRGP